MKYEIMNNPFCSVPRTNTEAAHRLATMASSELVWLEETPPGLGSILEVDASS